MENNYYAMEMNDDVVECVDSDYYHDIVSNYIFHDIDNGDNFYNVYYLFIYLFIYFFISSFIYF